VRYFLCMVQIRTGVDGVVFVNFSTPRICLKSSSRAYVLVVGSKNSGVCRYFVATHLFDGILIAVFLAYRACYVGDAERECVELSARPGQDTSRSGVAAREGAVRQTRGVLRLLLLVRWFARCGVVGSWLWCAYYVVGGLRFLYRGVYLSRCSHFWVAAVWVVPITSEACSTPRCAPLPSFS
jgi:hypothetical protein